MNRLINTIDNYNGTNTATQDTISALTYDALDRLAGVSYADSTLDVGYHYDEADTVTGCSSSYPLGRLTRVVEGTVTTVYCYDARGNVTRKSQVQGTTTDTTSYAYTSANRLSGISTPGQAAISYTRDSNGRISGVQAIPAGTTTAPPAVVSNVAYLPFGPVSSYTLGNGQVVTRAYDANYRLTDLTSPSLALHFNRDAMGNIIALGSAPGANPATETYAYDPLYRITAVADAGTTLESYTYNKTGDRLSKTASGLATGAYLYTSGTHQLASIGNAPRTNDANGNTTGSVIGGETFGFGYNGRNRLTVAQRNGTTVGTYIYNAMGQRIGKVATFPQAVTERYAYDEANQLIGEYGTTNRDYVWLGGMPVAVIDNTTSGSVTTSTVNYVTADQLGTPRAVTDGAGTVIWSWAYQGNPFGEEQPASTSGYVLNLRYPGQYYDAETGLMYNGARYLESATGRFSQPDPSGFGGGLGLYVYGLDNPFRYTDSSGLFPEPPAEEPLEADGITPANEGMRELQQREAMKKEVEQANEYEKEGSGEAFASSEFAPLGECKARDAELTESEVGPPGFRGSKGYQLLNPAYQPRRNQPGSVNGVDYSGHAFDQMQNRGFMPSVVSNAIRNGEPFDAGNGATGYYDPVNNISVITNSQTGRVVTVRPGLPRAK